MKVIPGQESMNCDDAIKCVFDLNARDIDVFKTLRKIGTARADEVARLLKKERSTIYRSLQKLCACGICEKKTRTLQQGGYYHVYVPQQSQKVRKRAERCLDQWYESVKQTLQLITEK
jgi:predicted transcriptional regulator